MRDATGLWLKQGNIRLIPFAFSAFQKGKRGRGLVVLRQADFETQGSRRRGER